MNTYGQTDPMRRVDRNRDDRRIDRKRTVQAKRQTQARRAQRAIKMGGGR